MKNIDEPVLGARNTHKFSDNRNKEAVKEQIKNLVVNQSFAILCTQGKGQPYGSLIAYAFTDDQKHYFFSTPTATRKYHLLEQCDRVALVIDSRSQHQKNLMQVEGVTITGKATRLKKEEEIARAEELLSNRHSYFSEFIKSESTALFRIDVVRCFYVTRFQEVSQWVP